MVKKNIFIAYSRESHIKYQLSHSEFETQKVLSENLLNTKNFQGWREGSAGKAPVIKPKNLSLVPEIHM